MVVAKTLAALILTFATFLIVGTLVNVFLFRFVESWGGVPLLNSHVIRTAIGFFGAGGGLVAAKGICDTLLKHYSGKVVCVVIVLVNAALWYAVFRRGNLAMPDILEFGVESVASIFASALFWTEDPLANKANISN